MTAEMARSAAITVFVILLSACVSTAQPRAPFESANGFKFKVYDGAGTYDSGTTLYTPQQCGNSYAPMQIAMDQETFDAIEGLVEAGALWDAHVSPVPNCSVIDVALPEESYYFEAGERSVSIRIGQCQAVDPKHAAHLNAIRRLVRLQSDRYPARLPKCVYF
ncbi:hypothetical protein [Arenimonas sp.]|uniref:hypothetical protein n=1 Tax=Arenimonas sp. TaxID=1872635 RepID=UPI0039E5BF90